MTYIWETLLQRQTRIDREFESLVQGGLSHAEFRALFEDKLQDIRECPGMDMPSEKLLYRKYLAKIKPEYRLRVMQKDWKIDGGERCPLSPQPHASSFGRVNIKSFKKDRSGT